jgi:beta-glucosidase
MVLLKNNGILPLDKSRLRSLYLTGPNALAPEALLGNYHGLGPRLVTFAEGLVEAAGLDMKVDFRHGSLLAWEKQIPSDWAVFEAREFDVTIACMGLNILLEGEEGDSIAGAAADCGDRSSIGLPPGQHAFLDRLLDQGKPVVLVIAAGSAVDLSPYVDRAAAIVSAWYPGEAGGTALADLLFGHRDFTAKLPVSLPRSLADLPPFEDYSMENRTYRYSQAEPLFPFGYGLSYRPIEVRGVEAAETVGPDEDLMVTALVENLHAGPAAGIVQIYVRKETGHRAAQRELAGMARVELAAGERRSVGFTIRARQMTTVFPDGTRSFAPGSLQVWAGTGQPDERSRTLGVKTVSARVMLARATSSSVQP